ncbi:MAG TPA: hypothetical protein VK137_06115, partial [Planctomycetaceae bacterium]|nr:hypothetical protein [Planctomycetaceae bacterium]
LEKWALLMRQSRLNAVPADKLVLTARQSSVDLAAWLRSLESSRYDLAQAMQLRQRLVAEQSDAGWSPTWDGQTQRYLAVVAISQSLHDLTGRELSSSTTNTRVLLPIQDRLRFPKRYATPRGFNPDEVDQLFRELRWSLSR